MSGISTIVIFVLVVVFLISSMFLQPNTIDNCSETPMIQKTHNPEINKIPDDLYLTNFKHAKDYNTLKELGVRQILTIGAELPRHGEPMFKVMHIKIDDRPDENIKKHFNSTFNFIKRGSTVVHCAAGISRSTTIVAAFLMRMYKMSADGALKHIQECRSITNPNDGFRQQLYQFEKELDANNQKEDDPTST